MIEHERRFLVRSLPDLRAFVPQVIMQGYLLNQDGFVVRVRRVSTPSAGGVEYGTVAIKGPRSSSGDRIEEEHVFDDPAVAGQVLRRCSRKLLKRRYSMPDTWVIDVFDWANDGLLIAELEGGEGIDTAPVPGYVGVDITGESVFNNEWLAYRPWTTWSASERKWWQGR